MHEFIYCDCEGTGVFTYREQASLQALNALTCRMTAVDVHYKLSLVTSSGKP